MGKWFKFVNTQCAETLSCKSFCFTFFTNKIHCLETRPHRWDGIMYFWSLEFREVDVIKVTNEEYPEASADRAQACHWLSFSKDHQSLTPNLYYPCKLGVALCH